MRAYAKRVAGGLVAVGVALGAVLFVDIPAKLAQADKSATFVARAIGFTSPPEDMATRAASHPWLVAVMLALVFLAGCGVLWGVGNAANWWKARKAVPRLCSPICIHNVLFLRGTSVSDKDGLEYADLEAVTIWLQVGNDDPNGQTLRAIRANLANTFGGYELPVKAPSQDLRHGELALVEVGTVVARPEPQTGFAPRAPAPAYAEDASLLEYVRRSGAEYRLAIAGAPLHYLGDGVPFRVTVTADNVPAQSVRLVCDFRQPRAYDWLRFEELEGG